MRLELSAQEQRAVALYDWYAQTRPADLLRMSLWADSFSVGIFSWLASGAEVVDVGCGLGRAVALLPDLGIEYYLGVDPSAASIDYCTRQWPDLSFAVGEIRGLGTTYPGRFGGFLLLAMLMHVPRKDLDRALTSLRGCLQPGARGMLATPFGTSETEEATNTVGLPITLYTTDELHRAFTRNGFQVIELYKPDRWMVLGHLVAV